MHTPNHWGRSFEIQEAASTDGDASVCFDLDQSALLRRQLNETKQGWILGPDIKRKHRYIDLGCLVVKWKVIKLLLLFILIGFAVVGLPFFVSKALKKHKESLPQPDEYTAALHKALLFFNAQRSGRLPKNNGIPWRGNSALHDGTNVKGGLVGGYYDSGDNIKFHFPMAFSMTLLSWSVIEYSHKYKAIGEYDHIRDIIKWGTDYLLLTFNSSASNIDHIYSQVGTAINNSKVPDDHSCWQRPEDMLYPRPVQTSWSAPDLGAEMAAALATASIVFRDNMPYSKKLIKGAKALFEFAVRPGQGTAYSWGNPSIAPYYNSTDYSDELIWSSIWMYCATGNYSYLSRVDQKLSDDAKAFSEIPDLKVLSWDNKLPGAKLLLARLRIFLDPGYPYEDMLRDYQDAMGHNMCSYLRQFHVFNWTPGGLIKLNHERGRSLQYTANAAFLASLFADYMNASGIPGWNCGPTFFSSTALYKFAASQVKYILGDNPKKMSYVVGYGHDYPMHVHHRGASTPSNRKLTCEEGWRWYKNRSPNPNVIDGAMVGGPDPSDRFFDDRWKPYSTEPTLAGNAGLVAALVSMTSSGGRGMDKNSMFSAVSSLFPNSPPSPPSWKP